MREVLAWIRQYGNFDPDADEPAPVGGGPARLSKEQRKFHKFDPAHPQATSTVLDLAPGASDDDTKDDEPPRGITAEQLAYMRRFRSGQAERRLWTALAVAIGAFLIVTGAFVWNHLPAAKIPEEGHKPETTDSKAARPLEAAATLPNEVLDRLDQAMSAEAKGEYANAIELLGRAQREAGHIYGLNYHLASLCYKANEMMRVLPLLDRSIADGEEVAACYSLRGTLSNQAEAASQQPNDLEKAALLDPLDARFFFVWGEALRRAGKPQLALPQLERAVTRVEEPALGALYALKLRLTQVELGQSDVFAEEMAEKLKESPPPVDWLFTAAAVQMHRGDQAAAVETLGRVRTLIGESAMARQLRDVFFQRFAREPELARFFDVPAAP